MWWDEHGVPRFAPFRPDMLGVYDNYVVLGEVECACTYCRRHMLVAVGRPKVTFLGYAARPATWDLPKVAALLEAWGDPPRHGCPGAGETMTTDFVRVVEAWERGTHFEWERRPGLGR